jgi:prophage regulatory protein
MAFKIYRRPEVLELTGWSTSTLQKVAQGTFPKPVKLDPRGRAVGWLETEIDAWEKQCVANRDRSGTVG